MKTGDKNSAYEIKSSRSKEELQNELKSDTRGIFNILLEAQECFKIADYIRSGDPHLDVYNRTNNYYWNFSTVVFCNYTLIKLNILFTKAEHFSIYKFIEKLKPGGELIGLIEAAAINNWEIEIMKVEALLKTIKIVRNKLIAHVDKNKPSGPLDIKFSDLRNLIALVQNIVKDIYMLVDNAYHMGDQPIGSPVESLKEVIQTLDAIRREQLKPLFDEGKKYGLEDELPLSERNKPNKI